MTTSRSCGSPTPQASPTVELATVEPQVGDRVVTAGWGCTNAPPECKVRPTSLQASEQVVLDEVASCGTDVFWTRPLYYAPTSVCTKGVRSRSTINRGDSGGPLLVRRGWTGAFRQVGVTTLGSDSTHQALRRVHHDRHGGRLDRPGDPVAAGRVGSGHGALTW